MHDFLWRYHQEAPERGKIRIFNRSYYEAVLVERVRGIAPEERWRSRYPEINAFEERLIRERTVVVNFFLHISKEEQRRHLQRRVDDPSKQCKFDPADLEERSYWEDYQDAFQDMVAKCNSPEAPWHVVPSDRKWYRDVAIAGALCERLDGLELRYPEAPEIPTGTVVV